MLNFPTSHALTDALIIATQSPGLTARLPVVLFLYELAEDGTGHPIRCQVIRPRRSTDGEGLDTTIVGRLEALTRDRIDSEGPISTVMAAVNAAAGADPGFRMLACAALDDDVVIADDGPHVCRRLDAVDIDGRVYQLTRYRAETHPVVTIDETPRDTPAAVPALRAALNAAVRLACRT